MAWHRKGHKPVSESIMVKFTHSYVSLGLIGACWLICVVLLVINVLIRSPNPNLNHCWLVANEKEATRGGRKKKELSHTIYMYWNKFYFQLFLITSSALKRKYPDLLQAIMWWSLIKVSFKEDQWWRNIIVTVVGSVENGSNCGLCIRTHNQPQGLGTREVLYTGKLQKSQF